MNEYIARFLHYLRVERGASAHTQDAYSRDLHQLAALPENGGLRCGNLWARTVCWLSHSICVNRDWQR